MRCGLAGGVTEDRLSRRRNALEAVNEYFAGRWTPRPGAFAASAFRVLTLALLAIAAFGGAGLARAVLHDPAVLLLVAPFDKCDEDTVAIMGRVIRKRAEEGASVLMLSEETPALGAICDVIYRLDKGRIVVK